MTSRPNRIKPNCSCGAPKHVAASGRRWDYCKACVLAHVAVHKAKPRDQIVPRPWQQKPCKCGAPKHVSASGRRSDYCKACADAMTKDWIAKHPERRSEAILKYSRSDHGIAMLADARARRYGVTGRVTAIEWRERVEEFGHACAYCLRTDMKLTKDHVLGLASGGEHSIDNIVPACSSCNSRKKERGILAMVGS
jgi:5-methylcytosine-specific restriction endonuclease McrA